MKTETLKLLLTESSAQQDGERYLFQGDATLLLAQGGTLIPVDRLTEVRLAGPIVIASTRRGQRLVTTADALLGVRIGDVGDEGPGFLGR